MRPTKEYTNRIRHGAIGSTTDGTTDGSSWIGRVVDCPLVGYFAATLIHASTARSYSSTHLVGS